MGHWVNRRAAVGRDDGNISVLTLGWVVLVLLALLVMAAATQVHIDRMRLASVADEAALAATGSLGAGSYFDMASAHSGVDQREMRAAVHDWLASDPRPWVSEVAVVEVSSGGDGTATVRLGRTVMPLFEVDVLGPFNLGIDLLAEGRSRVG